MKRDMDDLNLRDAFPPMPDACRGALMKAAGSVKEEEPVKHAALRTVLIAAAIVLATTAVALAAGSLIFGWTYFFKTAYNVDVPAAARQIMTNSDGETFTLDPVTFTVREKYCDPWTALTSTVITLNDGVTALLTDDDPFDPIGANGENGKAAARRLGVDPSVTWAEAAKQMKLPLYSVRAILEAPEEFNEDGWMGDTLFNEDGSLTYFCMPLLNGKAKGESVDCQLFLRVAEVNVDDQESQPEALTVRQPFSVPLQMPSETHAYAITEEYTAGGLTLTGVRAELTPAGVYLFAELTAREGMTRDDYYDNGQWAPVLYSMEGIRYGGGLNLTVYEDTENWPKITLMRLHAMDSIPDAMIFALEEDISDPSAAPRIILEK